MRAVITSLYRHTLEILQVWIQTITTKQILQLSIFAGGGFAFNL